MILIGFGSIGLRLKIFHMLQGLIFLLITFQILHWSWVCFSYAITLNGCNICSCHDWRIYRLNRLINWWGRFVNHLTILLFYLALVEWRCLHRYFILVLIQIFLVFVPFDQWQRWNGYRGRRCYEAWAICILLNLTHWLPIWFLSRTQNVIVNHLHLITEILSLLVHLLFVERRTRGHLSFSIGVKTEFRSSWICLIIFVILTLILVMTTHACVLPHILIIHIRWDWLWRLAVGVNVISVIEIFSSLWHFKLDFNWLNW